MKKVKISAVSYLNTAPFVYGLKHSDVSKYIDLSLDTPADCAARLAQKDADIGLIPVAAIPNLPDYHIISNYCIGATGKVRTVVLCSNSPINEINQVFLDNESRTSALLSQILLHKHWKINPEIQQIKSIQQINTNASGVGYVLIGDKVFDYENKFAYIYDLAVAWREFRSLPFTFATWTAVTQLSPEFLQLFNNALEWGLNHIPQAVDERINLPVNRQTAIDYLTSNISYTLDDEKKKALIEFWNLALEEVKSKVRS